MVDRERILAKLDELEGYVRELRQVAPESFAEYMQKVENRRACERLLQISIECIIDICGLFVSGLRLGLPAEEDDIFEKLERATLLSPNVADMVRSMKGFRNILVHEYGAIDNAIVFKMATTRFEDIEIFRNEVIHALEKHKA
jgi:uncharacterized protein YutE (UPF0331/DUF86 family)